MQSKGLSRVFSNTTVQKHQFFGAQLSVNETRELSYVFESVLPEGAHYNVQVENLGVTGAPILITQSEFMRRYKEMSAVRLFATP